MIDLLALAGLPRREAPGTVERRLAGLEDTDPELAATLAPILGDATRRTHYERVHLQYAAIAAARGVLELPGALDTHRWEARTVDFEPQDDDGAPVVAPRAIAITSRPLPEAWPSETGTGSAGTGRAEIDEVRERRRAAMPMPDIRLDIADDATGS